jgi:fucose permease
VESPSAAPPPARALLIALAGLAFVSLGLPDGLLGVAWPSMSLSFARPLDDLGVLFLAITVGYVASSAASGRLLAHLNLGVALAVSCMLTAAALAGFALSTGWWWLVPLSVVLGLGGGGIDTTLNTYAASQHGARALNLLHACYGVGAAAGPMIMTAAMRPGGSWQLGYAIVCVAQTILAFAFVATRRHWPTVASAEAAAAAGASLLATARLRPAQLGALTFVCYTGVEASFGAWTYSLLTLARGLDPAPAAAVVSGYWAGLTGGRVLAALAGVRLPPTTLLSVSVIALTLATLVVWLDAATALTAVAVTAAGLACGPIFPTLVAITPSRVGIAHTGNAVGLQLAAGAVGVATIPGIVGIVATTAGTEAISTALLALAAALCVSYARLHRWRA